MIYELKEWTAVHRISDIRAIQFSEGSLKYQRYGIWFKQYYLTIEEPVLSIWVYGRDKPFKYLLNLKRFEKFKNDKSLESEANKLLVDETMILYEEYKKIKKAMQDDKENSKQDSEKTSSNEDGGGNI